MEKRKQVINAKGSNRVEMGIIPGHFATNHSHINYYVELNAIKTSFRMAREAAKLLAEKYKSCPIDTIICLEGTEMIAAFLAQELAENGGYAVNAGKDIDVLTPEMNSNNQLIFRDDTQSKIWNKQILLLISSVSTGRTIDRFSQCLNYYNGKLAAVASIFSAISSINDIEIAAAFTSDDIPGYETYSTHACPMCKNNQKVDALVNAYGYSKI